jgi:hypothetical protein
MEQPQHWLQLETLILVLSNVPTTKHIPLAQPLVVFGNGHEFFAPEDVFSTHQWCFLFAIADGIPSPTTRQEISQCLIN